MHKPVQGRLRSFLFCLHTLHSVVHTHSCKTGADTTVLHVPSNSQNSTATAVVKLKAVLIESQLQGHPDGLRLTMTAAAAYMVTASKCLPVLCSVW